MKRVLSFLFVLILTSVIYAQSGQYRYYTQCVVRIVNPDYIPECRMLCDDGTVVLFSQIPEWNDLLQSYSFSNFYVIPNPFPDDSTSYLWNLYEFTLNDDTQLKAKEFVDEINAKFADQMPIAELDFWLPTTLCQVQISDSAFIPIRKEVEHAVELSSTIPEWNEILQFYHFKDMCRTYPSNKYDNDPKLKYLTEIYDFRLQDHAECVSFINVIKERFPESMPEVEFANDPIIPEVAVENVSETDIPQDAICTVYSPTGIIILSGVKMRDINNLLTNGIYIISATDGKNDYITKVGIFD